MFKVLLLIYYFFGLGFVFLGKDERRNILRRYYYKYFSVIEFIVYGFLGYCILTVGRKKELFRVWVNF